jgi:anti-sigma B factor antagonist
MDISTRKQGGVQVIRLKGALRLGDAVDGFRNTVISAIDEGDTNFVLNLADVPMIDSSGIGELIRLHTRLKREGGEIKLVNPGKFVLHTMNLVKIVSMFDIHDSDEAAANAFGAN